MKNKIEKNLQSGTYTRVSSPDSVCPAYFNCERGWINHIVSDKISFSHRKNDYSAYEYPYVLEAHDNYELIIYHSGEDLEYIADGQHFIVPQGSALLIKPHIMHMLRLPSPMACERYVLNFRSLGDLFPDRTAISFLDKGSANCALFPAKEHDFSALSDAVECALTEEETPFKNAKALARITELFIAISETPAAEIADQSEIRAVSSVPASILEIKEYIDGHYMEISSIPELLEHFFYNREYVTRCFRKYFGIPIYDYILRRRLIFSRNLLLAGESVSDAAQKAGFRNRSSFIKLFKKHFGCAPSDCKFVK